MYHAMLTAVATIVLQQAVPVTGRVIDDATGTGIADVRITIECTVVSDTCRPVTTVSDATGA